MKEAEERRAEQDEEEKLTPIEAVAAKVLQEIASVSVRESGEALIDKLAE